MLTRTLFKEFNRFLFRPRHEAFPTELLARHAGAGRARCKNFPVVIEGLPELGVVVDTTGQIEKIAYLSAGMQATALRGKASVCYI